MIDTRTGIGVKSRARDLDRDRLRDPNEWIDDLQDPLLDCHLAKRVVPVSVRTTILK